MSCYMSFLGLILAVLCVKIGEVATEIAPHHGKSVVCYWTTWSMYRPGKGKFKLENVDPTLCTHLIFAFTVLDEVSSSLKHLGDWSDLNVDENNQNNITKLKNKYPHLKVLVSIGGWQDGSIKYSAMAGDPEKRANFINSSIEFITEHDFDGLDIFWEYPSKRGGTPSDKANFLQLVKELRTKFDEYDLLLTSAIGASKDTIDNGYDMPGLSQYLDLMLVMCYDYHGWWSRNIAANAPLHGPEFLNVEFTVKYLLKLGADPSKLILGVPLYGRTFLIEYGENETEAGSPRPVLDGNFKNHTFHGNFTQDEGGSMAYYEICLELFDRSLGWTTYWDWSSKTPYAVNGEKLITYDNDRSLIEKTRFAMQNGLGGIMAWSVDMDDFRGDCYEIIDGRREFPLLRAINAELHDYATNQLQDNSIEASPRKTSGGVRPNAHFFVYLLLLILVN